MTATSSKYDHAYMKELVGVSNLKMFDGEDLSIQLF